VKANETDRIVDRALVDTEGKPVVLVEVKSLRDTLSTKEDQEATNYCELAKNRYGQKPRWPWLTNGREWRLFDSYQPNEKDPLLRLFLTKEEDRTLLAQLLVAQGSDPSPDNQTVLEIATWSRFQKLLPELWKKPPEPLLATLRQVLQERLSIVPDEVFVTKAWQALTQTTKPPPDGEGLLIEPIILPPPPEAQEWSSDKPIAKNEARGTYPVQVQIGDDRIEMDNSWVGFTVAVARYVLKQSGSLPTGCFRPRGKKSISIASTDEGMTAPKKVDDGYWIETSLDAGNHCRQAAWIVRERLPGKLLRVTYAPVEKRPKPSGTRRGRR
jgi:hypothetical protein